MDDSSNQQGFLAEQFLIEEISLNHESYDAMMKIKHWKFILKVPGIGSRIIAEAGKNIEDTFFSFLPAADILDETSASRHISTN